MKFLSAVFLLSLFSNFALAQQVETTIDGETYLCHPAQTSRPTSAGNAIDCINMAYAGPFSREQSVTLCQGARNTGPALCAIKAYAGPFSMEESLRICQGARSAGPVDCFMTAYAGPFSREESLNLCKNNPHASAQTAQCAIQAYAGPYSREEALRLCSGTHKSFQIATSLSKEAFNELAIKANEKAMAEGIYKK